MLAGMEVTTPVSASPGTDLPGLLRPSEVAELLGASERTVRRLAQDGVLERVRIGHRTSRYTRRSVLALVDPENDHEAAVNGPAGKVGNADAQHQV